jgi:O-antigen ligase
MTNSKYLTAVICLFGCFTQYIFFTVMGMFGERYEGLEVSNTYAVYSIAVFSSVILIYSIKLFKYGLSGVERNFYIFFITIIVVQLFWEIFEPISSLTEKNFAILFLLVGLPGFFSAVVISRYNIIKEFIKISDILAIVLTIGIIFSTIMPFMRGEVILDIGGTSYQFLSYLAALTIGILLFNTYRLEKNCRFSVFTTRLYFLLGNIFIFICLIALLLGGGRGAFLVMIFYFTSTIYAVSSNKKTMILKKIITLFFIATVVAMFFYIYSDNESIKRGADRAVEYIFNDGPIDLNKVTSGRDEVYAVAITGMRDSILIGYGPFSVREKVTYPHNFFLEIILQFGLLSVPIFFIIMVTLIKKIRNNLDFNSKWILNLSAFPVIMLMFSGSYMLTSIFWFCLVFLFLHKSSDKFNLK